MEKRYEFRDVVGDREILVGRQEFENDAEAQQWFLAFLAEHQISFQAGVAMYRDGPVPEE